MYDYEDHGFVGGDSGGGELAASFSPQTRMQMIQMGYNPMSPGDVAAFKANQRPKEGASHMAGVNEARYKNMGDRGTFVDGKYHKYNDARDYGALEKAGLDIVDYEKMSDNMDPRTAVNQSMNNYGGGAEDLNTRLQERLSVKKEVSTHQAPQKQNIQKTPIAQPRQLNEEPQILTEAKKATKLGYTKGVKYINAFIENIKNPTSANRAKLIEEMNRMVSVEEKIHPNIIQHYRAGIAAAESELYKKLKK